MDGELTQLLEGIDRVELKITVPESDQRSAIHALGMDPLDAQIRQVLFFDTPGLALFDHGLVVRARRTRQGDDTVVQRRPVVPHDLPQEVLTSPALVVEVAAMPGRFVCSASLEAERAAGRVQEFREGKRALKKVFTKEQRGFFKANAPEGIGFNDLSAMGPITTITLDSASRRFGRPMVAEMWMYPDGSRVLELSSRCKPADAFDAAAETRELLRGKGIDVDAFQETKTARALRFLTASLAAAGQTS